MNNNNLTVAYRFNQVANQFEFIIDDYSVHRRHEIVFPYLSGNVLITGSGPGSFIADKKNLTLIHMDIAYDMCRILNQKKQRTICGDAEKLPFSSSSLDSIIALEMLYYLGHPDFFLKEAFRTLKPGGQIIISSFNQRLVWYDRVIRRLFRILSIGPQYFDDPVERFFYQNELEKMISDQGFQIKNTRSILIVPFKRMKSLDLRLEKTIFKHFAMFNIIIAQKIHETNIIT